MPIITSRPPTRPTGPAKSFPLLTPTLEWPLPARLRPSRQRWCRRLSVDGEKLVRGSSGASVLRPSGMTSCTSCTSLEFMHHRDGYLIAGSNILFWFGYFHIAFPVSVRATFAFDTTPLEGISIPPFYDYGDWFRWSTTKKIIWKNLENLFENPATLYIPTFTISFFLFRRLRPTPIFRLTSRSLAMLSTCCERRRLRFDSYCILFLTYDTDRLSGRDEKTIFSTLTPGFFPVESDRWCIERWLATWRACFMGTGVDFCSFWKWARIACERSEPELLLTYTVTYLFFLFHDFLTHHFDSHFLGLFCSWGGTDFTFVFIKDLEAETIHVCIAWALLKLSGMCFFFIVCLCVSFLLGFSCTSVYSEGNGWYAILITSLPRG